MEGADALVIEVDEFEIVELLQQEVTRVVVDAASRMVVHTIQQHLERRAVKHIFTRVQFERDVASRVVERIEDRAPAFCELIERRLDQPGRTLWPRIQIRPRQRTGETGHRRQAEIPRCLGGPQHLLHRPLLSRFWIALHGVRRERIERFVVHRMHCDELSLQVRTEFGDLNAVLFRDAP